MVPQYPLVLADREVVVAYGGIDLIPTTFVIDRKGYVQSRFTGYQEKEIFESLVKKLL